MLKDEYIRNGIYYLSDLDKHFEDLYLQVREKEGYVLSVDEIYQLPISKKNTAVWKMREQSAQLIAGYLKSKQPNSVLEIGCGNGWFCNYISDKTGVKNVYGLDINDYELKQAFEVFGSEKIKWLYADVFSADLPEKSFDVIVLNASIQYFPDF